MLCAWLQVWDVGPRTTSRRPRCRSRQFSQWGIQQNGPSTTHSVSAETAKQFMVDVPVPRKAGDLAGKIAPLLLMQETCCLRLECPRVTLQTFRDTRISALKLMISGRRRICADCQAC